MATNLVFAIPDIPFRAAAITPSSAAVTSKPIQNVINGARHKGTEIATANTGWQITFDLGASVTSQCEFLVIAGAKQLYNQGVTGLYLSGHNGGAETTVVGLGSTFQSATLSGIQGKDFIAASGFNNSLGLSTSLFRYWKLYIGSPTSKKYAFLKLYAGMFFDMGRDPEYTAGLTTAGLGLNAQEPGYTFKLQWKGITDAKKAAFINSVFKLRDINPIFLYTRLEHGFLNDWRLVHCMIKGGTFSRPMVDSNTITIEFEVLV